MGRQMIEEYKTSLIPSLVHLLYNLVYLLKLSTYSSNKYQTLFGQLISSVVQLLVDILPLTLSNMKSSNSIVFTDSKRKGNKKGKGIGKERQNNIGSNADVNSGLDSFLRDCDKDDHEEEEDYENTFHAT